MKFKNKIEMCRHDAETVIRLLRDDLIKDCSFNINGICIMDKKKCKVVTYVKEVRNED